MKLIRRFLLVIICSFPCWINAQVTFERPDWQIAVNPETLAINIQYPSMQGVELSEGGDKHRVSSLKSGGDEASWEWDDGAYEINVQLKNADIIVTVRAKESGTLTLLRQSGASLGKALILPVAEGHYIPVDNTIWKTFLSSELHKINTTQDLSLPLWANEHPHFSASWLLLNPYNNQIQFDLSSQKQLSLTLSHQFTRLAVKEPFIMQLSVADNDPLAGAKRYRQWLIDNQLFEPFANKVKKTPEAGKLIGATHLYVWGSDLLAVKDIANWPQFLQLLKGGQGFAGEITAHFDKEAKDIMAKAGKNPDRYQKKVLISAFNDALKALARQAWQTKEPDLTLLASRYQDLTAQVQQTFSGALAADRTQWGGGLSTRTISKLTQSGLSRLWIGVGDGWEGGLWHPGAVLAAVKAGFLIAPYDSYQTALPTGFNPDWATAHLGERAYNECAITQEDGSLKAGFQKSGHYTNPLCIRPWLEQRIAILKVATGFNSWFLDAYATGMVFDNYAGKHAMTQADNAKENGDSMAWVADKLKLVTGSEDGNAVTTKGIFFAHGMQTPVLGWGDKDLNDPKSPYYLGRWYPNDEPSVFFKSAPLKEPYKTVYFSPEYRLPLYQTVFHDSVITSQHWLFDNLKLSNTLAENQLTQLFYNVPALYNVSENTLEQRLTSIVAQDAFFRPLHQRLIDHTIVKFEWLTGNKRVQKITFSDGTVLIANFSAEPFKLHAENLPGNSVTAYTSAPDIKMSRYVVTEHPPLKKAARK